MSRDRARQERREYSFTFWRHAYARSSCRMSRDGTEVRLWLGEQSTTLLITVAIYCDISRSMG
jgi:hypothetical protein